MFRTAAYITLVFLLASCSHKKNNELPVARVYDTYLYPDDIKGVGSGMNKPEDSIEAVKNYIDSWIRHQLLLRYAEDNMPDQNEALTKQLQDYKESLLIYNYEKELIDQKLDTTVSDEEVAKYFADHKDNFELKSGIVQLRYVMLEYKPKMKLDSLRKWMKNPNEINDSKLNNYCEDEAVKYSLSDSTWFEPEQLMTLFPTDKFDVENAQYTKAYFEVPDSNYMFLIRFQDYKFKGNDAPLSYVKQDIYNIIMNKRKLEFVNGIHTNIYNQAKDNGKIEIY